MVEAGNQGKVSAVGMDVYWVGLSASFALWDFMF